MAERTPLSQLNIPQDHSLRVGIVCARFNEEYTDAQLAHATALLEQYSIPYDLVRVAGCYEIPYALEKLARTKKYTGLVALGTLIKGGTIHFEVISYTVGNAVHDIVREHAIPVGFGVITANTKEQAHARVEIGAEATHAALDAAMQFAQA